jgi:hypothetical protein
MDRMIGEQTGIRRTLSLWGGVPMHLDRLVPRDFRLPYACNEEHLMSDKNGWQLSRAHQRALA